MQVTRNEIELPNVGNPSDAEFLYEKWKLTDANNSNAKIYCIGEKKGKNKFELLRKICALGNAGGGILFWGVNENTNRVEGISLKDQER